MKRKLSPGESRRILSKVKPEVSFWLCTNEQLYTLEELGKSLHKVNDEIFRYHVNRDKNDFETWIRDVINDRELAREISRIKTRETLVRKIEERVVELRSVLRKVVKPKKLKKAKPKKRAGKKSKNSAKVKRKARKIVVKIRRRR